MTIGACLAAFALEEFLVPNSILDGGITGVSIILSKLTNLKLGLLILFINVPFIYIGYKNIGKQFLIKAVYSMVVFAILLDFFEGSPRITDDILLAMVYGGVLLGIGVGFIIKCGGCVDGTESVAIVISKKTSLSVGQVVLMFNLIIFSDGLEKVKSVMIISENGNNIAGEIYKRLGRTCTLLDGSGLITGSKSILYVVVTRLEVSVIKRIVDEEDKSAFVTVSDVSEIIGNHIKSTKEMANLKRKKKVLTSKKDHVKS